MCFVCVLVFVGCRPSAGRTCSHLPISLSFLFEEKDLSSHCLMSANQPDQQVQSDCLDPIHPVAAAISLVAEPLCAAKSRTQPLRNLERGRGGLCCGGLAEGGNALGQPCLMGTTGWREARSGRPGWTYGEVMGIRLDGAPYLSGRT